MAKRCDTRICRKGHRPLWRILPSGTPAEPVPLKVPTSSEWDAERLSWSSNNVSGAFGSPLKLTIGGRRLGSNGSFDAVNTIGYYRSSTVSGLNTLGLVVSNVNSISLSSRTVGSSVRLILDGNFTLQEFQEGFQNNSVIIHGSTYGYVYNTTTQKIWLDRNLGATQVATSSTDADSYGWLYQWGRLTDGHQIRTPAPATTSTLSTTDVPLNGDFITIAEPPNDWRDPQNDNLWQGVDGINNPAN